MLSTQQRFALLAKSANRNFAYAVVYGELTKEEAGMFCTWLNVNGVFGGDPKENLALYMDALNGDNSS